MILKVGNQEIDYRSEGDLIEAIQQYHYDNLIRIMADKECKTAYVLVLKGELGNKFQEKWHFWAIDIPEKLIVLGYTEGIPLISRICTSGIFRICNLDLFRKFQWETAAKRLGVNIEDIKRPDSEWTGEEYDI